MIMTQRMRQLNIDDFAGDITKMSQLIRAAYLYDRIDLNPIVLARLIVEYDLQDAILNRETDTYFTKSMNSNLKILRDVQTNISYDVFVDLIREMDRNYVGDKPKIKMKRSSD